MYQDPANLRFGGGASESTLHPAILFLLVLTSALMWLLPRRYILIPFIVAVMVSPFGQQVYVAGLHLFVGRCLILVAWSRLGYMKVRSQRAPFLDGGMTPADKAFFIWAICRAMATVLSFGEVGAAVNQLGFLWDTLGGYFLFRSLIRDEKDIVLVLKTFTVVVAILSCTMVNEQLSGTNVFGYIGGRLAPFIRDGKIRSQGPFVGPIPAGTFGATCVCLFFWLYWSGRSRGYGAAGICASILMIMTSMSSTPLITVPAALLAVSLWPFRKQMRVLRWGLVVACGVLHMTMKAPVWMIISHVDVVGGNSSYHRAMLIDGFMRHFADWWLIGVKSTANWGWDMWDQANQFVLEGEAGGLVTLGYFIVLISRCFGRLGTTRKLAYKSRECQWSCWLLGCALFSQVVSFFGISFSDQSVYGWYALLAMIMCITAAPVSASKEIAEPDPHDSAWWPERGSMRVARSLTA